MFVNSQKIPFLVLKSPICDDFNPIYLRNLSVRLYGNKLDVDVDLVRAIQSGVRLQMDFSTRRLQSTSFTHFYQYSLDICSMLSTGKNNIFKRWFSTFFAYGNFQRSCPVPPKYYYMRNYKIYELDLPPFLTAGIFRLELKMIQSNGKSKTKDFVFHCEVEVEIK